jgi:hypothetical protein
MVKRFVVRGLGIVDPSLAESVLTDAVSYLRRGCVEHHRRRIGISLAIFSSGVFFSLGSPKVSVLNGWNEGRGKRGTFTLFKETLASVQAAGHGEQMRTVLATKTVPRFAVLSVPSSDDCGSHRPRCHVPRLGHQLNPRFRNTCPIVQILHCLDPFSMC